MVIQIKAGVTLIRLLTTSGAYERVLPRRYKAKKYKLHRYYNLERAAQLLDLTPTVLFHKLAVSKNAHALYFPKEVLVHPDAVTYFLRAKGRALIRSALKKVVV